MTGGHTRGVHGEIGIRRPRGGGPTAQQESQRIHGLRRALVTHRSRLHSTRKIRRDDVDGQPSLEHLIERGDLPGELRGPELTTTHGQQETNPSGQRGHASGEGRGVDAERVSRRQKDVVVPERLGPQHDVATMRPRTEQVGVDDAELLVIVVAQRREPTDLAPRRHGNGTPSLA